MMLGKWPCLTGALVRCVSSRIRPTPRRSCADKMEEVAFISCEWGKGDPSVRCLERSGPQTVFAVYLTTAIYLLGPPPSSTTSKLLLYVLT